jgi:hypothetical protein
MPQAPRGVVGQRIEMPAGLAQFTALKVNWVLETNQWSIVH